MKVLTTPEFVEFVERLPQPERQDIAQLFEVITKLTTNELFRLPATQVLVDTNGTRIFALRSGSNRLIYSIEKIEGSNTAILLSWEQHSTPKSNLSITDSNFKLFFQQLIIIVAILSIELSVLWVLSRIFSWHYPSMAIMIIIATVVPFFLKINWTTAFKIINSLTHLSANKEKYKK